MSIQKLKKQIQLFWSTYEPKIVTIAGFLLVAGISFEFGALQGQKWEQAPLIIEKPAQKEACNNPIVQMPEDSKNHPQNVNSGLREDCNLMGSKNSNKYHLPTCQWAKRIKPANIVCFNSAEDAMAKKYQPDKGCIK